MARKKLTLRQENFCTKYVECLNAAASYTYAFEPKCNKKQIYERASLLLNTPKIIQRISELKKELDTPLIMSREEKLKVLQEMIGDKTVHQNSRIKAIEVHNAMTGHNEPIKIEESGTTEKQITIKYVD